MVRVYTDLTVHLKHKWFFSVHVNPMKIISVAPHLHQVHFKLVYSWGIKLQIASITLHSYLYTHKFHLTNIHRNVLSVRVARQMSSLLYGNTIIVCVCVCLFPISSRTAGPIWLHFFLLAPSWSRKGFRPKKFRIRDPVFPEIRKKPDFRVLFDQFG